jgi:hypothetical protein
VEHSHRGGAVLETVGRPAVDTYGMIGIPLCMPSSFTGALALASSSAVAVAQAPGLWQGRPRRDHIQQPHIIMPMVREHCPLPPSSESLFLLLFKFISLFFFLQAPPCFFPTMPVCLSPRQITRFQLPTSNQPAKIPGLIPGDFFFKGGTVRRHCKSKTAVCVCVTVCVCVCVRVVRESKYVCVCVSRTESDQRRPRLGDDTAHSGLTP